MTRVWPLTPRGTGAVVLALACFILSNELGVPELVYFGVVLLAVVGVSLASLWFTRRTESVRRVLSPEIVAVGRQTAVAVRVGVRTALPIPPGTWRDAVPKGLTGRSEGVFTGLGSGLRAGDRMLEFRYTVRGLRRGVHSLGPLSVSSTDPFGLARRSNVLGERTKVIVAPAIIDLPMLSTYVGETGGTLHATNDQLGQGADNLIARPYAPGDSMRRIHWRATAHRDTLMVRQEEQESSPEATVVLDRGVLRWSAEAMQAPGADAGFEAGVSACISAVARLVRDGYAVDVLDSDGTVLSERIDGGATDDVEALAAAFATLTARRDDHLTKLPSLFAGDLTGPVVVVTGRFDTKDADALAPLVHHTALPVLLAVMAAGGALDLAADYGWRAASIPPDADLAAAWAATADGGMTRVGG